MPLVLQFVGQKCSFSYDKVFDHSASQDDVFVEMSQLVQSALDGYKVIIFQYKIKCCCYCLVATWNCHSFSCSNQAIAASVRTVFILVSAIFQLYLCFFHHRHTQKLQFDVPILLQMFILVLLWYVKKQLTSVSLSSWRLRLIYRVQGLFYLHASPIFISFQLI